MRVLLLPCLALLLPGVAVAAPHLQEGSSQAGRPRQELQELEPSPGATMDINRIDPDSFRAIAARLPSGRAPKVDGRLDEELWDLAPPSGNFVQREPHAGAPASERTEFRILYDDRKIYFGIWAFDSDPGGIRASEMKRDSGLKKGDRLTVVIDTFHDRRNGFYFGTNPLGAYKDAQYTDNARVTNNDWNAVWECRTTIDDRGWYAEIAIPLSQLRFRKSPGETTWGLNVGRQIVRRNEESYWVPYPRAQGAFGFARLSNAGVLTGLRDLSAPRRLEFVPFLAPQAGRDYDAGVSTTKTRRYGFDARVGLTGTLVADLTYRTDFAQVEADQETVNVSRFSLFFPEKRQFFTESAGLFDFGKPGVETGERGPGLLPLLYSRRIGLHEGREVPLLGGARVTGRAGAYAVGVMNLSTEAVSYPSADEPLTISRANYSVVRVKRNLLAQSSMGAILLNRQGGAGAAFNRAAGVDLNLVLGRNTTVTGLAARTFSPEGGEDGGEHAAAFDLAWQNDRFNYGLTYLDVGAGFNAEMGYIRRTDIRNPRLRAAWTPRPRWRGVRQLTIGGMVETYENHAGGTESRTQDAELSVLFDDTSTIGVDVSRDYDLLALPWQLGRAPVPAGGYKWDSLRVRYSSNSSRPVSGRASVETGGYYNGDKTTYSAGLNLQPLDTLLIEMLCNRNTFTSPFQAPYRTNTLSTRVSYSFSPSLFAKGFVQYNDDRRLASLNLLFWYIHRPGSDFYLVYNHGWNTNLPGPRATEVKNRSLALKITYWLSR
jgi:hypothetical protein